MIFYKSRGMFYNLTIFFISYFFIKLLIINAKKLHLLDIPNERSHHCSVIPRGAGIGFISAVFLGFMIFQTHLFLENWFVFLAIFFVFLLGILDDRHEVSVKFKFLVISLSTLLLWIYGLRVTTIGTWFGYEIHFVWWVALPFSMFAISGFTNALNLIDGLDGLAGSISVVILIFFYFIGLHYNDVLMMYLAMFTIVSLTAFLILNWNPAKIFMGDSGSLTLGFIISVLSLLSLRYISPVLILYLGALPILDTLIVMIRRIRRGKSPFQPDKTHIHHILVKFFDGNVKKTVIFLVMLQLIFSATGYILIDEMREDRFGIFPVFAIVGFIILFIVFYMIFTGIKKRQKILDRKCVMREK
jgi:UDP-GlcNAc:undecaprenyl-phosphate/decaprenyl-phosphate GlcNAc-1-phosphate transferase